MAPPPRLDFAPGINFHGSMDQPLPWSPWRSWRFTLLLFGLLAMQPAVGYLYSDEADLSRLRDLGRKILIHHGLGDDGHVVLIRVR